MKQYMGSLLPLPVLLAGCVTVSAPDGPSWPPSADPDAVCQAETAQSLVGQRATAELGAELQRLTGARTIRWVPPRTAVTMDYRHDRLTVSYDDTYRIDRISCG